MGIFQPRTDFLLHPFFNFEPEKTRPGSGQALRKPDGFFAGHFPSKASV